MGKKGRCCKLKTKETPARIRYRTRSCRIEDKGDDEEANLINELMSDPVHNGKKKVPTRSSGANSSGKISDDSKKGTPGDIEEEEDITIIGEFPLSPPKIKKGKTVVKKCTETKRKSNGDKKNKSKSVVPPSSSTSSKSTKKSPAGRSTHKSGSGKLVCIGKKRAACDSGQDDNSNSGSSDQLSGENYSLVEVKEKFRLVKISTKNKKLIVNQSSSQSKATDDSPLVVTGKKRRRRDKALVKGEKAPSASVLCIQCNYLCENKKIFEQHRLLHENDDGDEIENETSDVEIESETSTLSPPPSSSAKTQQTDGENRTEDSTPVPSNRQGPPNPTYQTISPPPPPSSHSASSSVPVHMPIPLPPPNYYPPPPPLHQNSGMSHYYSGQQPPAPYNYHWGSPSPYYNQQYYHPYEQQRQQCHYYHQHQHEWYSQQPVYCHQQQQTYEPGIPIRITLIPSCPPASTATPYYVPPPPTMPDVQPPSFMSGYYAQAPTMPVSQETLGQPPSAPPPPPRIQTVETNQIQSQNETGFHTTPGSSFQPPSSLSASSQESNKFMSKNQSTRPQLMAVPPLVSQKKEDHQLFQSSPPNPGGNVTATSSPKQRFVCPSCPKTFSFEPIFKLHLKTHAEGFPLRLDDSNTLTNPNQAILVVDDEEENQQQQQQKQQPVLVPRIHFTFQPLLPTPNAQQSSERESLSVPSSSSSNSQQESGFTSENSSSSTNSETDSSSSTASDEAGTSTKLQSTNKQCKDSTTWTTLQTPPPSNSNGLDDQPDVGSSSRELLNEASTVGGGGVGGMERDGGENSNNTSGINQPTNSTSTNPTSTITTTAGCTNPGNPGDTSGNATEKDFADALAEFWKTFDGVE